MGHHQRGYVEIAGDVSIPSSCAVVVGGGTGGGESYKNGFDRIQADASGILPILVGELKSPAIKVYWVWIRGVVMRYCLVQATMVRPDPC